MRPASGKKMTLSLNALQEASSEPVYRRGVQYYRRKKVLKYDEDDGAGKIEALVIGSEPQPYKVLVGIEGPDSFKAECSCPYFEDVCKHSVAVILTHIARANPGIRFDLNEGERGRDGAQQERAPKAKDLLEDPRGQEPDSEDNRPQLGILVLEKPLALIVGTVPQEKQGKVNILKVPPEMLNVLDPESRIYALTKYLTMLPQTTKGMAGGHRIPRGDEGTVIGHLNLCAKLINTADGSYVSFSQQTLKPLAVLSETESGELMLKLEALNEAGEAVPHPVFFLGQMSWVLSENTFYNIDLSAIHRLFQFFDAHGQMTVKLEIVPKFLAVDLPILMKRMAVRLDETSAPFPVAITEPPKVVIKLSERKGVPTHTIGGGPNDVSLEVCLGFKYGDLVLPSRDETSAVEAEQYTRTMSDKGQSVWVKRLWDPEHQVRRFLSNLQPQRTIADRFFFADEAALDTLFYLQSEQCADWEVSGWQQLKNYKVRKEPLKLKAKLSLKKDSFKFDFDLLCSSNGDAVAFPLVIEALFRNRNYLKMESGEFVRLPTTLLSLLKTIGQSKDTSRPLYQALPIAHALETHEIEIDADAGFRAFLEKIHNFNQLEAMKVPDGFQGELRVYQKEGCNWLSFLREYGLA
ncbi:MAG TPA: SNF2 helicase associated domain-containing protein, partial [Candidatus Obscuribacterales bacterium]